MKKLLSIFLVLIMCTGWLVSCDNEDATSSSESQSQGESEMPTQSESYSESESESESQQIHASPVFSSKELGNFGSPERYIQRNHNNSELPVYDEYNSQRCYQAVAWVESNLTDSYSPLPVPKKPIFKNLTELSEVLDATHLTNVNPAIFETCYVVYVEATFVDWNVIGKGFHTLTLENDTLCVYFDVISHSRAGTELPKTSILNAYIAVPKAHFKDCDIDTYTSDVCVRVLAYRQNSSNAAEQLGSFGCPIDCLDNCKSDEEIPLYDEYNSEHTYKVIADTETYPSLPRPSQLVFESFDELSKVLNAEQLKGYGTSVFKDSYVVYAETNYDFSCVSSAKFHRFIGHSDGFYICLDLILNCLDKNTAQSNYYGAYIVVPKEHFTTYGLHSNQVYTPSDIDKIIVDMFVFKNS